MNGSRILLIDANPEDQNLFKEIIRQLSRHCRVDTLMHGGYLSPYLDKCRRLPAFIIMEYNMQPGSALDVLQFMAKDERFRQTPIYIWSRSLAPETIQRCLQAGATEVMIKPTKASDLKIILRRLIATYTESSETQSY